MELKDYLTHKPECNRNQQDQYNEWWLAIHDIEDPNQRDEQLKQYREEQAKCDCGLNEALTKAENLPISGVTPRFCFICGSGLKDAGHDWLQCESEECAEMFRTNKDAKGNQHVIMFRTPFTPK